MFDLDLRRDRDEEEEERDSRSILGLGQRAAAAPRPGAAIPAPAPNRPRPPAFEVPRFDLEVEREPGRGFPVERAILFSLAAHLLLVLLLLWMPEPKASDPRRGLLAALMPPERSAEEKIPIVFQEAPGPSRQRPRQAPFSDADRRAGGGDRSRPRSEKPFIAERPGKTGLEPGAAGGAARRRPVQPGENGAGSSAQPAPPEQPEKGEGVLASPRVAPQGPPGRPGESLSGLDEAIREAARGVGRGEEGAGYPNPDGGFVDSGPLSFDTTWYDWGAYAAEMVRRIKLHWDVPSLARLGWKGKVTIRFFILADGRVEGATILSRSGVPPFDHAAFQAIVTSSPFRPLPKDLGSEREGVTVTFYYNIRLGQSGSSEGTR